VFQFSLSLCNYQTERKIIEHLFYMITTMRTPNFTGTDMSSRKVCKQLSKWRKTEISWDSVILKSSKIFTVIQYKHVQCVRKVAVHLDSGMYIWLSVYRDRPRMLNVLKTAITAYIRNISHKQIYRKCLGIKLNGFRPV
jgi:hypothetical protein